MAPEEVIQQLEKIERKAKSADHQKEDDERYLEQIDWFKETIPTKWKTGKICYRLALAYGELGRLGRLLSAILKR